MEAGIPKWLEHVDVLLTFLVSVFTFSLTAPLAQGQCVSQDKLPHVERFSAIEDLTGLPGPSGIELTLEEEGTWVTGVLRDYEGLPDPLITKLKGTLQNCDVDVKGNNRRGKVEIRGTIMIASFQCIITRHIAGKTYSEKVSLRRENPEPHDIGKYKHRFSPLVLMEVGAAMAKKGGLTLVCLLHPARSPGSHSNPL